MKRPERLTHGDSPIVSKYRDKMNILAKFLDGHFNGKDKGTDRKVGFVLLVFPFNDGAAMEEDPRINYISNGGDRRDIADLFREMIRRFEKETWEPGTKQ